MDSYQLPPAPNHLPNYFYLYFMNRLLPIFLLISLSSAAQDIDVEYDKKRDFSRYKTFRIGESEVITPKDAPQSNENSLQKIVAEEIIEELTEKGLKQSKDSIADLVVSFVAGSQPRSDLQQLGPLGMTPGNSSQTWSRDFTMENLIIDLNDKSNLVWRITASSTSTTTEMKALIDSIVSAGFKKFSLKPKKEKKK